MTYLERPMGMEKGNRYLYYIQPNGLNVEDIFHLLLEVSLRFAMNIKRRDARQSDGLMSSLVKEEIESASIVIADISDLNSQVTFEIGIARALNKPIILMAFSSKDIPFELSAYRVLLYGNYSKTDFKNKLFSSIKEAIDSPLKNSPDQIEIKKNSNGNVFISYSHKDTEYLARLLVHLKPLENEGKIIVWKDTDLRAGDKWKDEIQKALDRSNAAVLLISADFLASDFIIKNELPPLLSMAEEKGTKIIPVILKPCRFARDKLLQIFQAINDPSKPMVKLNEGEQEAVYDNICSEIEKLFN
jgi:hypothetical protein